jgi:hypothetical protein
MPVSDFGHSLSADHAGLGANPQAVTNCSCEYCNLLHYPCNLSIPPDPDPEPAVLYADWMNFQSGVF